MCRPRGIHSGSDYICMCWESAFKKGAHFIFWKEKKNFLFPSILKVYKVTYYKNCIEATFGIHRHKKLCLKLPCGILTEFYSQVKIKCEISS